jgi:hypothetical protein
MNTRDLVIFGAGALTGYLITQYLAGKIVLPTQTATATTPEVVIPIDIPSGTSQADCENKMSQQMSTIRFGSEQDMNQWQSDFMRDCLNPIITT